MLNKKAPERWKTQRHFARYTEIISVLVKHGFGEFLDRSHKRKLSSTIEGAKNRRISRWVRIRHVFEDLGVTFIKFGQIMSNRPDILPAALIEELEKLQSNVPPFPFEEAKAIIEEEYGKPIEKIFREFTEEPLASASIAQVHRAELLSGERVVVKVQRPNLEEIITTDIEIMHTFASLLEALILRDNILNVSVIIDEFGKSLHREIDFLIESSNIKRFETQFKGNPHLYVPKVYLAYTTKRVLVMEYIQGIRVSNIPALLSAGNDPKAVARYGTEVVIDQVFRHGFFHADPHPGNIFVLPDNTVCFIDFGMMGFILPRHREILNSMMIGLVEMDERRVSRGLLDLARTKSLPNMDALEYEIYEIMDVYGNRPIQQINIGELITKLLQLVVSFRLAMPPGFFLLAKSLVTIEGVALRLDPDFNMLEHLEPIVRRMFLRSLGPKRVLKELSRQGLQLSTLLRDFPGDAKEVIEKLKEGRLVLQLHPADLKPILKKTDQISNRISFSVVLASLVIGSSIVINARIPPLLGSISLIGIAGFIGAGLIGFWLLFSMLRDKSL